MAKVKVGDWVTSYTAGIWKVYKILDDFYELKWNLDEKKEKSKRVMVFSKRLCHNSGKRSFSTEGCELTYIDLLDKDEINNVNELLKENEKLEKAFNNYIPKPVDLVSGLEFSLSKDYSFEKFTALINELFEGKIELGLTIDEINTIISKTKLEEFKGKYPINASIQVTCKDHELKNNEFIFKEIKTFNF